MVNRTGAPGGVGAAYPRKEDERYLRGRGEYIADIRMQGMREVAFVRSPLAHARVRGLSPPPGAGVYTAADLAAAGVRPIVARSALPGFKSSEQPVLAAGRVRFAGECLAACVAPDRARAEDLADAVALDLEPLAAVSDMCRARDSDARGRGAPAATGIAGASSGAAPAPPTRAPRRPSPVWPPA